MVDQNKQPNGPEYNHQDTDVTTRIATLEAQLKLANDQIQTLQNNEIQHRANELALERLDQRIDGLHRLDLAMLKAESIETLAQVAVDILVSLMPCYRITLGKLDLEAKTLYALAVHSEKPTEVGAGKVYPVVPQYLEALANQPYTLIDTADSSPNAAINSLFHEGIRTILLVGLHDAEGKLIGMLNFHSTAADYFTEEHIYAAVEVANLVAIGMHKSILIDTTARYAHRMKILHEIDSGLLLGAPIPQLVQMTLSHMRTLFKCEQAGAVLFDYATHEQVVFAGDTHVPSELYIGHRGPLTPEILDAVGTSKIVVVDDIQTLPADYPLYQRVRKEGMRAALRALLVFEGEILGVIVLNSTTPGFFNHEDQVIATELGDQLAIVIHQKQLMEALQRSHAELEERVVERTTKLQATIEQIEAILNNSVDAIILISKDLVIEQFNAAFERIFGGSDRDYLHHSIASILPTEGITTIQDKLGSMQTGEQTRPIDVQAQRHDGNLFDAELTIGYVKGDGLVCVIRDVTERKRAEKALQQSEEQYRLLAENITDLIVKLSPEGIRTFVTPSCTELLGYRVDELVGRVGAEIIHPEDAPEVMAIMRQAIISGASHFTTTQRVRHKEGHYVWVETKNTLVRNGDTGKLIEIISVIRDISERKQAEEALRQSEEQYRLLAENITDMIVKLTPEGIRTFVSGSSYRLLGYHPEELINRSMAELTHPLDWPDVQASMQRALTSQATDFTVIRRVRHKDGHYIWTETKFSIVQDAPGGTTRELIGLIRDISARKQAEDALRDSEEKYRQLFENNSAIKFLVDNENRIVDANSAAATFYGYPIERLKSMRTSELSGRSADESARYFAMALTETQNVFESRHRLASGEIRDVEVFTGPVMVSGKEMIFSIIMDISERKRAEQALRDSEAKFRQLVETMQSGLLISNSESQITYLNDRAIDIMGYSRDEILSTSLFDYVDEDNAAIIRSHEEYRQKSQQNAFEITVRHKNGEPKSLLVLVSQLWDNATGDAGTVTVITDITPLKRIEQVLEAALKKEFELGELKTRFLSMASHEFRNPLASIQATTETLQSYSERMNKEQISQRLAQISKQVYHMNEIMEDILQLSRLQSGKVDYTLTEITPEAFCRDIIEEFQSRPNIGERVQFESYAPARKAWLDSKLMRKVMNNLLSNALKYSNSDAPVHVRLVFDRDQFTLTVQDHGIGIPEQGLVHLFEPFYRASNVGEISGTGLGLVILKESVKLQGGSISVTSEVGVGSTFTVTLPAIKVAT